MKWFVKSVGVRNMGNEKIVWWRSMITGIEGHGKPLSSTLADTWVIYGNENFPEIEHKAIEV